MGIKESALLDLAVNRPQQSAFGEDAYPDIPSQAAEDFTVDVVNHKYVFDDSEALYLRVFLVI